MSEMLSHSDFDMKDIGRKKTAVFIIVMHKINIDSFWAVLLFDFHILLEMEKETIRLNTNKV